MSNDRDADSCFTGFDLFHRRVHLRLPSGSDKFKTCLGGFLSIMYLTILIVTFVIYASIVINETIDQADADGEEW